MSVKPWVGMWGADAERIVDSTGVKGPGGGGWLCEWYVRREEGSLKFRRARRMRVLVAIVVIVWREGMCSEVSMEVVSAPRRGCVFFWQG